ncbi:hypothetical protein Tco_0984219 [Tanacetum coccineum]
MKSSNQSIAYFSSIHDLYSTVLATTLKEDGIQTSIGIYNGVKDTIEFQDYWSSAAMANVMQNILQMLNNTCHWMGPTAVADNANSQPTESTYGTHRTTSAPRSPNPDKEVTESSKRLKKRHNKRKIDAKAYSAERRKYSGFNLKQIENEMANVIPSQVKHPSKYMSDISSCSPTQSQHPLMTIARNMFLKTACRTPAVRPRDQDDHHDDAHPEERICKAQEDIEYEAYCSEIIIWTSIFKKTSSITFRKSKQDDDFDFWTDSYASDDDEFQCEAIDIVWESRKEFLFLLLPHPWNRTTPLFIRQKDPEAPALSLINQDLLYLKKGNSGPEKIVLSLHKFPAIIFNDDDIEE